MRQVRRSATCARTQAHGAHVAIRHTVGTADRFGIQCWITMRFRVAQWFTCVLHQLANFTIGTLDISAILCRTKKAGSLVCLSVVRTYSGIRHRTSCRELIGNSYISTPPWRMQTRMSYYSMRTTVSTGMHPTLNTIQDCRRTFLSHRSTDILVQGHNQHRIVLEWLAETKIQTSNASYVSARE